MRAPLRWITAGMAAIASAAALAGEPVAQPIRQPLAAAELSFLDYLDAAGAIAFIESGATVRFDGLDLGGWRRAAVPKVDGIQASACALAHIQVLA